jgi:hypothetical protein
MVIFQACINIKRKILMTLHNPVDDTTDPKLGCDLGLEIIENFIYFFLMLCNSLKKLHVV